MLWALPLLALVSAQATPSISHCPNGSQTVFLLQHNVTIGRQIRALPTAAVVDCSDHCAASNDCVGVEFLNGNCKVFGAGKEPSMPSAKVLMKSCVKSERVCSSPFHFDLFEQKILVGFAREVVPAEDVQVCMSACLNSFDTFGFECESAMFYPVDQECILNTEDRLDRPDLFADETEDKVIYMDNNCAGSQCYAPYITQYIAVEGKQLENELDRIINVDVDSCQSLCTQRLSLTVNDFNCKSFMYNNRTRTCILSDERSKPLGRGTLINTDGFNYYEKKCFASPNTCRNIPSFTRVPQMILVGFAAFVMENVPSVTMCLDQCTNPPPETGDNFECKSVMYYYNEQECILNAETRHTKPDLFIPEGDEFQVDYFDISCHLKSEKCPAGTHLKAVRTVNAALPEGEGDLHVLKAAAKGVKECMKKCFGTAPEKCRSFNYDKQAGTCSLLYLDSMSTLRPQIRQGTDLYDLHCLAVEGDCSINKDDALFSRYLHTKQRGIASKTYKVVSLNSCLEVCAGNPTCAGVNYNRRVGQCDLFDAIDGEADLNEHVDFYKNLCVIKETDSGVSAAANVPAQTHRMSGTVTSKKKDSRGELLATKKVKPSIREHEHHRRKPEATLPIGPPVSIPPDAIRTICNYEGIKVQVNNGASFSAVLFVKNKYDTCRVEVANSNSATLVLGLPRDFGMRPISLEGLEETTSKPDGKRNEKAERVKDEREEFRQKRQAAESRDCGLIDMLNGTYKTTVVIQTNNLGIPGLVTSMDQLYEVSCDYSSMLGGKVQAGYNMTVLGPEPNLIQPRGKIELGNPVFMQLVSGDGEQPVVQAKLGDILELRWEIMAMDDELDFFVKDCFAEPGVGAKAEEKLQLIQGGCPTPAVAQKLIPGPIEVQSTSVKVARMQAFRFDSSSSVRVTCELDICKGDCTPVECGLTGGQRQSWGRKKRESENSVVEYETARYRVPKHTRATTSIVIIDPLQQVQEPVSLARASAIDFTREEAEEIPVSTAGQMCLAKPTLIGVFGLLLTLTSVQAIVVIQYLVKRLYSSTKL
uniref:PAN-1 domain containing protein n=1 Tax=Haemonchus contortus TaxID=6289 RepID=A0A7I4XSG9_HAECO